MAKVLFLTNKDIKTRTPLGGNVDTDKFQNFIRVTQDINLQGMLGTRLYVKLQNDVINSTLTGNYKTLVDDYIKDFIAWYSLAEYMPFAGFTINNGGVFSHESENSVAATRGDINALAQMCRDKSEHYGRRLYDYLCANNSLFPEWNEYQTGDMTKQGDATRSSWVL